MSTKQRDRSDEQRRPTDSAAEPSPALPEIREQANELLSAGDEAINRVLSSNSLDFLKSGAQTGGQ